MKILQLISTLDPANGGPVEGLMQMAQALQNLGHCVNVATLDSTDVPWLAEFPFKVYAFGPSLLRYGFNTKLVPWLREYADDYDVVIVNGIWQYHSFATWRALRKTKVPYFVFTHGMLDPWFKRAYPLKHVKKWLYWPWAEYRVLRDAKAVFFTSDEERILLRESFWLYRCNEVVVNFGIKGFSGDSSAQVEFFCEQFPLLRDKRILLFLGRIHLKKGCDLLIKAFSDVCQCDESLHLVFVGPDQDRWKSKLEKLAVSLGIDDRITWTGMVTEDTKWGAFHAAEIFVLPSHSENFGAVVTEALSCGLPVLISNKVNIWREIINYKAGLVENDDLAGTIRLLERWLQFPPSIKTDMRLQSTRCFREKFEINMAVENLISAIKEKL